MLFQDESRIVVDASLPKGKQEWPSLHEAGHRILEWHRPYFFGDTAQTLDPDWQQILEEEANYAASALMFAILSSPRKRRTRSRDGQVLRN